MKILIIQQKMIGDVLTTSILFEALKEKYPKSQLHYLINSHTYPVVQDNPFIDEFIFFTPEIEKSNLLFYKFLKTIKKERFNVTIDVYGKLSSSFITVFSKSKTKIAYHKKHTSFIYTHTLKRLTKPENNSSLAIENRLKLLEPLGVNFINVTPKIYLNTDETNSAKQYLESKKIDKTKPLFMISVLGSSDNKTYPVEYMAKLLDSIIESKSESQILFNYIPKQKKEAKEIYNYCSVKTQNQIFFNVFGKSLREFLSITKHCNALIGNEGGANNMAKALDVPTFTIFSPYLNKQNWYGQNENEKHIALHLSDFIDHTKNDTVEAKKNPKLFYLKFKSEYIIPKLKAFLKQF